MIDPLTAATSVAGLLSLTIQVSQLLYDQVHSLKSAPKAAQELLDELNSLSQVLARLESFLSAQSMKGRVFTESSVLITAIRGFKINITDLKAKIEKLLSKRGFMKMIERGKWLYEQEEHQEMITTFHRYLGMFQISLSMDGIDMLSKSVDDMARDIKGLKSAISVLASNLPEAEKRSKQLDDILQLLSPLSSISNSLSEVSGTINRWDVKWRDQESQEITVWLSPLNFWTQQTDIFGRHQEGTGQWFLDSDEFRDWMSQKENTLWCPGIPGAGKTVLAIFINRSITVNHLREQFKFETDVGVAFIYYNYKEKDMQTPVNLLASLWSQLVQHEGSLSTDVKDLYKKHTHYNTRPTISEVSTILRSVTSHYSSIFVVVDALDECTEADRSRAILLAELRSLQPNMSLMVTSRFLDSIAHDLEGAIQLEIGASVGDVRAYVRAKIAAERRLSRHVSKDEALGQEIIETVVGNSKKMFLLAQLHMDSLATKGTCKILRRALETLPKELDATYDEAMERIEKQNEYDRELASRILYWISYARRPLTLEELQHALAVELGDSELDETNIPDEELLTSVCAGLVAVDQESKTIRLVHFTTQNYFERVRKTKFPDGQTNIAATCLTYLAFDVFAVEGPWPSYDTMKIRMRENVFLNYAALQWGFHAREGPEHTNKDLILKFFKQESNLLCSIQAIDLYNYRDDSKQFQRISHALFVSAYFGLKETIMELVDEPDIVTKDGCLALNAAATNGHDSVVQLLVEKGADVNAKRKNGDNALFQAASRGYETMVLLLLESGADVNSRRGWDESVLYLAARNGHNAVVRLLLENGASCDTRALYGAVENGHESTVLLLLRNNAKVNSKVSGGETALCRAVASGHDAIIRLLLDYGADVTAESGDGWTALHLAAERGNEAVVQLLLEKGANIEAKKNRSWHGWVWDKEIGWTALQGAADMGHRAVVQLLLENGADIEASCQSKKTALVAAAENGHEVVVRLLLEKGADINSKCNKGQALCTAAEAGQEVVVGLLLEKGADTNSKYNGRQALCTAAKAGREAVVRLLLEKGVSIEEKTDYGETALYLAAFWNHEAVVRLLLEKGANVEAKVDGETALFTAAQHGYVTVLRVLLENGAHIEAKDKFKHRKETALWWAVAGDHRAAVRLLLEKGANINANGGSALLVAAERSDKIIIQLLLDNGADIAAKTENGRTALHEAVGGWNPAVIQLLLDKGADVKAQTDEGETALFTAAKLQKYKIAHLLLQNGAEVEAKRKDGSTALHRAVEWGPKEVVQLLLENGADIEAKTNNGRTALSIAATKASDDVKLRILLERGASVNVKTENGRTALHWAATHWDSAFVQLLLDKGADIEARTDKGETTLFMAAKGGRTSTVRLVLEKGADIEAKTDNGETALFTAAEGGHTSTVKLLLEKGADVEVKTNDGETALSKAVEKGNKKVVRLLKGIDATEEDKDERAVLFVRRHSIMDLPWNH